MTKIKTVTLAGLDKEVKLLSKVDTYYLDDEMTQAITYNLKFDNEKIDELLAELSESVIQCKTEGIEFLKDNDSIMKYVYFLVIKHFTSFKSALDKKDIYVHIQTMHKLYQCGWFELIINEALDPAEIKKVVDKVNKYDQFVTMYEKELRKRQAIIEENAKAPLVKAKLLEQLQN